METKTIKSPEGVKHLVQELWEKHRRGERTASAPVYMVELPKPTEEEKRIMAINRANRKPIVIDEEALKTAVEKAVRELGGW